MNKKETINKIQRKLKGSKGYPVMEYLLKLTETDLFHLLSAIIFSDINQNSTKVQNKSEEKWKH